jgi:Domain of unknown function (DUF4365)
MTSPQPTMEGEGIHAVALAFVRHFRWFPRELPRPDFGIDLHVEGARGGRPTGRFIGVQVKAGSSYFAETSSAGIVFRDATHRDYWLGHSIPVIVALYDPDKNEAYWQVVTPDTFISTGKGWKLTIPWDQRIDAFVSRGTGGCHGRGQPWRGASRSIRGQPHRTSR